MLITEVLVANIHALNKCLPHAHPLQGPQTSGYLLQASLQVIVPSRGLQAGGHGSSLHFAMGLLKSFDKFHVTSV